MRMAMFFVFHILLSENLAIRVHLITKMSKYIYIIFKLLLICIHQMKLQLGAFVERKFEMTMRYLLGIPGNLLTT